MGLFHDPRQRTFVDSDSLGRQRLLNRALRSLTRQRTDTWVVEQPLGVRSGLASKPSHLWEPCAKQHYGKSFLNDSVHGNEQGTKVVLV